MAVQTVENIQRLPPFLEGLQKRLLQTGFGTFDGENQTTPGLLDRPLGLPGFQIAGADPLQDKATQLGEQMVGSFQPFLRGAADQSLAAQQALTSGLGFLQPESIKRFQDPFQEQVIDVAMRQLNRQADMRRAGADAAAVRSGAFGGSREGVQRAETERGLQQVKGDTLSRLLSQGFGQALKASQDAGRLSGGIGQAFGTLAGTTSDLGRLQQALGQADVSQLSQLGALRQRQQQAGLDAMRANLMQQAQEPFTRLQIGQNLLQGMPSASIPSTFQQATTPGANPFLQGVGAYTTLSQIAPFGGAKSAQDIKMAPKQGLNLGDTDTLLKSLNLPSQPKTFSELAKMYGQGLFSGEGPAAKTFIPPVKNMEQMFGTPKTQGGKLLQFLGDIPLAALEGGRLLTGGIGMLTNPAGNIPADFLAQVTPEEFEKRTGGLGAGPELFLPEDQTSSIPGSDIFTQKGQDKLTSETNKALENLIGKSVGDVGAFDPQGEVDQETIDKIKEQQQADVEAKTVADDPFFNVSGEDDGSGEDTTTDTTTEVDGADTPAKKATVKALDEFFAEARPGISPKTFDEYINEFGEATGLDVSGEADTKQALMSFGLALMQNRAGKGFDVSKILTSVGEAGEAAMPDFRKAVAEAKAIRAKAGSYALSQRESDQKKAMDRRSYVVVPKEGGLQRSVLQDTGRFSRLNSYELNNLMNNAEFNERFEIIDASTYMDMTKSLITAANKNKKKVYLEKPRSVPLFGGSKITVDVFYANPNNDTGAKPRVVAPELAVNAIETMEKGLTRRIDKFRDIAKVINETGVTAGDQIRSFGNQLAISFGIPIGKGETDPVKRLKVLLTELKARNAAEILGESGKTISDNDRKLVDDIVGAIDVFSGDADIGLLKTKLNRLFKQITASKRDEIEEAYTNLEKFGVRVDRKGAGTLGTKMVLGEDNVFRFRPQETT